MSATTFSNTSNQTKSLSQRLTLSRGQYIVGGLGIITTGLLLVYLVSAVLFLSRPFPGMMVSHTMLVNGGQSQSGTTWTALDAGLRPQDQIIGINEIPLITANNPDYRSARSRFNEILGGLSIGDVVTIDYVSNADASCTLAAACSVEIELMSFPDSDFLAYFIMPFAGAILVVMMGWLVMRYASHKREGQLAATIAFTSAIFGGGLFDVGTQAIGGALWLVSAGILSGALFTFGTIFPREMKYVRKQTWIKYAPIGISTLR